MASRTFPPCCNFPAFPDPAPMAWMPGTFPPPLCTGDVDYLRVYTMEVYQPTLRRWHTWVYRVVHYRRFDDRGLWFQGSWDCNFCFSCASDQYGTPPGGVWAIDWAPDYSWASCGGLQMYPPVNL